MTRIEEHRTNFKLSNEQNPFIAKKIIYDRHTFHWGRNKIHDIEQFDFWNATYKTICSNNTLNIQSESFYLPDILYCSVHSDVLRSS